MTPAAKYLDRFERSTKTPDAFARWAVVHLPNLCLQVLEQIGSWQSSEPELAALQRVWPS